MGVCVANPIYARAQCVRADKGPHEPTEGGGCVGVHGEGTNAPR
jgi:hypothetical protein